MRAADLLVQCLEAEGVRFVFGVPGEEVLALLDALSTSRITFIPTRHEQAAALMADVYGRLTGRPGVCIGTLGPGATNLMTGVADAYLDHAPLVVITGQTSLEKVHKEAHQYINTMDLFHPITKWQAQIAYPEVVPEVVRKAFKIAESEKPGPTHIELPEQVAREEVDGKPLPRKDIEYPRPSQDAIQEAAAIIATARRPIILAGNGVVRRRAAGLLQKFAEKIDVPVVNTFMSKGVLDYTHPLAQFTVGGQNHDYEQCGLSDADVVITIGYDYVEFPPSLWNPRKDKSIIHLDTLSGEVDQHYIPAVEIVSEISDALQELTAACAPRDVPDLHRLMDDVIEELRVGGEDPGMPLKPTRILSDLRRVLGQEDTIISDVGAHKQWLARMFPASRPNSVIISNGFATMGFGLPGGIAAKLAEPDRRVVVVTGDGGFMMNVQDLETAVRIGTAFVIVVWVDNAYGVIKLNQERTFGRTFGVDFGNPDFAALAASFGVQGFNITRADDFAPTLEQALHLDQVSIIAVPVDYSQNYRLAEAIGVATARA